MKVIKVKNYDELSKVAANIIIKQIKTKNDSVIGLATGSTPVGTYDDLAEAYNKQEISFKDVRTFNLDEYINVPKAKSYHTFMYDNLFSRVDIDLFKTNFPDESELEKYEEQIELLGIDLQVLGIGVNGHIGFNEPGTKFDSTTHIVELSETTRESNKIFFDELDDVPTHAVTMGLASIMKAKKILLLASGTNKKEIINKLIKAIPTEDIPASILLNHKDVIIIADEDALLN